jgi:hypothetical protein
MSETTQQEPTESAPVADPAAVVTPETTEEQQAAESAAEPEPEQPKERRQPRLERHVANLTRELAEKDRRVEESERRAQAAEAMLQAGRDGAGEQASRPGPSLPTDIEARADAIAAQREFNRRLSDIDAAGKKEAGTETWEGAKAILTGLGATKNQAFLEALAETSNPTKIFAALADDSDEVMALLRKSPAAMAAHLGRLDAKMETTAAPRASSAPKPPAPLRTPAVQPDSEELFFDPKTSIKEWAKLYDARMPKSLGGRR